MTTSQQASCRAAHRRNRRTHINGRSVCRTLVARSQWFASSRVKVASR
jgi:hypothetical protein